MKPNLTPNLKDVTGSMDKWIYRRFEGRTIIAEKVKSTKPPTASQLVHRDRFKEAADYAKAVYRDPVRRAVYADRVRARGRTTVFATILADYFNLPQVKEIELGYYNGHVGDLIRVKATDDFEVVSVKVTIKDQSGNVLESGLATRADTDWVYHAQTAVPRDQNLLIEAEAKDRPGHETALSEPWHA